MKFGFKIALASAAFALSAPAMAADVRLNAKEQLEAIRLLGSEEMMVYALSQPDMPRGALFARQKLLKKMALVGKPGSIGTADLDFSPIMTQDPNINGGYESTELYVGGIPFQMDDDYRAKGGFVLGLSGSGKLRINAGRHRSVELEAAASIAYAPKHDIFKGFVAGSACLNQMFSYSTFGHACYERSYQYFDLGEGNSENLKIGFDHIFESGLGFHQLSGNVILNHNIGNPDFTQLIGGVSLSTAMPGPYAFTFGAQFGAPVDDVMVMRERVFASVGFLAFDRPTSISASFKTERGGRFLGEPLKRFTATLGASHQINKHITINAGVSKVWASNDFFDKTEFRANLSFRF